MTQTKIDGIKVCLRNVEGWQQPRCTLHIAAIATQYVYCLRKMYFGCVLSLYLTCAYTICIFAAIAILSVT